VTGAGSFATDAGARFDAAREAHIDRIFRDEVPNAVLTPDVTRGYDHGR
jgi:hypothetical protein